MASPRQCTGCGRLGNRHRTRLCGIHRLVSAAEPLVAALTIAPLCRTDRAGHLHHLPADHALQRQRLRQDVNPGCDVRFVTRFQDDGSRRVRRSAAAWFTSRILPNLSSTMRMSWAGSIRRDRYVSRCNSASSTSTAFLSTEACKRLSNHSGGVI